jgi:hypothetical protein
VHPFPLTLALSLREREQQMPTLDMPNALDSPTDERQCALSMSLGSPESCRRFSLSPSEGERVGVRGRADLPPSAESFFLSSPSPALL